MVNVGTREILEHNDEIEELIIGSGDIDYHSLLEDAITRDIPCRFVVNNIQNFNQQLREYIDYDPSGIIELFP